MISYIVNHLDWDQKVIGGLDPLSKGSWLAINTETYNLAFLTNYDDCEFKQVTDPKLKRGVIISVFVKLDNQVEDDQEMDMWFEHFIQNQEHINGVNFVYANAKTGIAIVKLEVSNVYETFSCL